MSSTTSLLTVLSAREFSPAMGPKALDDRHARPETGRREEVAT
jgi:hypothetical protein